MAGDRNLAWKHSLEAMGGGMGRARRRVSSLHITLISPFLILSPLMDPKGLEPLSLCPQEEGMSDREEAQSH